MTNNILRLVTVLGLLVALSACGLRDDGPQSVGLPFDARLSEGETRRDFSVRVIAPGATLEQARESARFEATRHCLEQTGFSAATWSIDPSTGDWAVARTDAGEPVVSGRCDGR